MRLNICLGDVLINYLKDSGFCSGVKNAFDTALKQLPKIEAGEEVYLYGHLANNKRVMDDLISKGFKIAVCPDDITKGSTVVIRSHGVPEFVYTELAKKNAFIIDCTCTVVKNIHKVVKEKSEAGDFIIIIGKKGHPEVEGIYGWCKEGHAYIVESLGDIDTCFKEKKLTVVGQTTCDGSFWESAAAAILQKYPHAEIHNTLCSVVSARVKEAAETAKKSDVMVIVGDINSANSLKLVDACKNACKDVRFISCLEDMAANEDIFIGNKNISLAGSASTPGELLEEINAYMLFVSFLFKVSQEYPLP